MKVIVAHPGRQHSLQTALAMKENGILFKYMTTVYDKPGTILSKVKWLLGNQLQRKSSSRKMEGLKDSDVMLFGELSSLLLILISKLHLNRLITDYLNIYIQKRFADFVAKYAIKHKVDVVIMYDTNVYDAFDMIHQYSPNTLCVLDTTIASRKFIRDTYEKDLLIFPNSGLKEEQSFLWHKEEWMERYCHEFKIADYYLVGSDFVKHSIMPIVQDENKIINVPYGVNLELFYNVARNYTDGALHFLFVGGVVRRKGIHHLLKVVSKYSKNDIILHLAGAYNPKDCLYKQYNETENIIFEGFVTRDIISKIYQKCHIFILPSLAEGMAMVGLEALASGLPVICSENTGLDEVIKDGQNGFIIPVSDEASLEKKIDWCLDNREKLNQMSINASESVVDYSWLKYRKRLIDVINNNVNNDCRKKNSLDC